MPGKRHPDSNDITNSTPATHKMSTPAADTFVIINADDLGHSAGINQGIEQCHRCGVLTSASLMVNRAATPLGVEVARRNPRLSVGLHVNVTDEDPDAVDLDDVCWVAAQLQAQYAAFQDLLGRKPSHLDSHHHIHWNSPLTATFQRFAAEHGLQLRHYGQCRYEGGFYGQWEHGITDLTHVQAPYLCELIRSLTPGWHEFACHPGHVTDDLGSIYNIEREEEVRTLVSSDVSDCIRQAGVRLCNFHHLESMRRQAQ